jgi:hypothetical protein
MPWPPPRRGIKLGNPKQAEVNRAKAAEQAQALCPHIERCIEGWPHVEQCDQRLGDACYSAAVRG